MTNKKRVSLYLNIDNPKEKEIWDFLESYGKKNECIRNALYQYMIDGDIKYVKPKEDNKLNKKETDYMLNNIIIG
ncbi:hypothetical protein [uncultured Clostridium sp.]|jgi:hypothetical protein|uniref:hypothetical protein n=1 Tax=uncultured Clostridium sp. TaxID=59620 RepID=UPI0020687C57|nr:hypothetical protein [uncultured Clostridium sp.]DAZ34366.1 MAG TPA: hypothetical protein [Caudoviricetes sp.]